MLVNGICFFGIVEFYGIVKEIRVAELLDDGVCRVGHPNGVICEVIVFDSAVCDGTGRIAALILIGENSLESFPCELRIDTAKTFAVAGHIAVAVMTYTRPTRAHVCRIFHPTVDQVVEILPRSLDGNTAEVSFDLCFHRRKFRFCAFRSDRSDGIKIIHFHAELEISGLGFAGSKCDGVLQSKAELFGVTIAVRAAAEFAESRRMLFVAVRTDERIASCIKARDLFGCDHVAIDLSVALGPERTVILGKYGFLFFVEAALTKAVCLRTVCTVDLCFRVGNEVQCAFGVAVVGERYAPDLASALVRNEDANGACNAVIGKANGGEAVYVVASVIGVAVVKRKTEKAPMLAIFRKENVSVREKKDSSAHVVLTKTFAKTDLRRECYIFIVEHVVIPMTGRFGLRYGIGIIAVKMSVPFEFCHSKKPNLSVKILIYILIF